MIDITFDSDEVILRKSKGKIERKREREPAQGIDLTQNYKNTNSKL